MNIHRSLLSVRPEPVEGLFFFDDQKQKQGFDKLSPNGEWVIR